MRTSKKFTPFITLSRHKQRDKWIELRQRIQRSKTDYGANFTSPLIFDEPGRPDFYNQWFDFYFLGLDGHTIWNTVLYTANEAYWNAISDIAREHANAIVPYPKTNNFREDFIPVYDQSGRLKHYTMREEEKQEAFKGRTRYEFQRDYESELIQKDTGNIAPVYERFELDTSYKYGIGLHAVIDAPYLTKEGIEGFIARFRAMGEKPWQSATPVPHENLPKDTFNNLATEQKLNEWSPNNS